MYRCFYQTLCFVCGSRTNQSNLFNGVYNFVDPYTRLFVKLRQLMEQHQAETEQLIATEEKIEVIFSFQCRENQK
jgi:hypothetical protein